MKRKDSKEIRESINRCMMKLRTIQPHLTPEKVTLNESFNRLLIEKAVLKDKLEPKNPTFFNKLFKKLTANRRELICDYFN